jgi:hypothetical protein
MTAPRYEWGGQQVAHYNPRLAVAYIQVREEQYNVIARAHGILSILREARTYGRRIWALWAEPGPH